MDDCGGRRKQKKRVGKKVSRQDRRMAGGLNRFINSYPISIDSLLLSATGRAFIIRLHPTHSFPTHPHCFLSLFSIATYNRAASNLNGHCKYYRLTSSLLSIPSFLFNAIPLQLFSQYRPTLVTLSISYEATPKHNGHGRPTLCPAHALLVTLHLPKLPLGYKTMAMLDFTTLPSLPFSIPTITAFLLLAVLLSKYVYRLTFHPLAGFPGPKLAAATSLYGASTDLLTSGSYVKQFPALHDRYGRILAARSHRVTNNHQGLLSGYGPIISTSAISKYTTSSKFDKDGKFYANPAIAGAFSEDPHRKTALPRKKLLSPGFTREAVRRGESRIASRVDKFLEKLSVYAETGRPVNLSRGSMCLAADTVMDFAFQKPYNALDAEDFQSDLLVPIVDFCKILQWPMYFPRMIGAIFKITSILPTWVLERWFKGIVTQQDYRQVCDARVKTLYAQSRSLDVERTESVFETAFNPNLEKGQSLPPLEALGADAFVFLLAGTDTTSKTFVTGIFALLDATEPHMLARLKQELHTAIPDRRKMAAWATLEQLPYLRAFVKESLRLSLGAPGRLPRVVPETGATFCGRDIPAGVSLVFFFPLPRSLGTPALVGGNFLVRNRLRILEKLFFFPPQSVFLLTGFLPPPPPPRAPFFYISFL
ncbi:MAG: hypothetical protein L6R40_002602 [Gallowayella cf. fulva]|nr:MAG: hypothetical protein L6R40_002602 [Xanthomendoza cf. fulva]